jgi:two-component system response regulator (stage 0 sporulation protein F)
MKINKLKGKILVVDDQQGWRELLEDILSEDGYEVVTASNFKEAIDLLKRKHFDLATIDMRLVDPSPYNIDGMRVLKETKTQKPLIKAIILTGYPDEAQKDKALNFYGADGYYEKAPDGKPFDIVEFKQIISNFLE